MTTLRDLNREEWADKPYLIELCGGRNDGKRFRWHELPWTWRQPEPVPLSLTVDLASELTPSISAADYRETGSVTDDGAHVYELRQ